VAAATTLVLPLLPLQAQLVVVLLLQAQLVVVLLLQAQLVVMLLLQAQLVVVLHGVLLLHPPHNMGSTATMCGPTSLPCRTISE
jgi:hypothetical protein